MQQTRWIPCETALGVRGEARTREAKGHKAWEAKARKAWNLPQTVKERLIRSNGKSLAQSQVAIIDPTCPYRMSSLNQDLDL